MTNHITDSEWRDYFARGRMTADRLRLFSRVHAHLGSCAECRALHQHLSESSDALRRLLSAQSAPEQAAYLAVASDAPAASVPESTLSIEIENGVFLYGTLSLTGDFLRYEFLPESDSPCLADACDPEIRMEIADNHLSLHFRPFPGTDRLPVLLIDGAPYPLETPLPSPHCHLLLQVGGQAGSTR